MNKFIEAVEIETNLKAALEDLMAAAAAAAAAEEEFNAKYPNASSAGREDPNNKGSSIDAEAYSAYGNHINLANTIVAIEAHTKDTLKAYFNAIGKEFNPSF